MFGEGETSPYPGLTEVPTISADVLDLLALSFIVFKSFASRSLRVRWVVITDGAGGLTRVGLESSCELFEFRLCRGGI